MTMHAFVSGELVRDAERRVTKTGNPYVTALLRCGEAIISVTAFDDALVERLLPCRRRDPLSVAGRLAVDAYLGV